MLDPTSLKTKKQNYIIYKFACIGGLERACGGSASPGSPLSIKD